MIKPISAGLPEGFDYLPDFLSVSEERAILDRIDALKFGTVEMRGMVAKQKVLHFGWMYGYESWRITRENPLQIGSWLCANGRPVLMQEHAENIEEVLLSQYSPGAGIGWHRDAPMFGPAVVGISLLGTCRLRFQRKRGDVREQAECSLEPRSAYVLNGQARAMWQHSIPDTKATRYSITLRTLKRK